MEGGKSSVSSSTAAAPAESASTTASSKSSKSLTGSSAVVSPSSSSASTLSRLSASASASAAGLLNSLNVACLPTQFVHHSGAGIEMQFYASSLNQAQSPIDNNQSSSSGGGGSNNQGGSANASSNTAAGVQTQFLSGLSPALAYQNWFGLQVQQQQQAQQQQHDANQLHYGDGGLSAYLDTSGVGQDAFHHNDTGGVSLNLASLQSFASQLQQHVGSGQTFMIQTAPAGANNPGQVTIIPTGPYVTTNAAPSLNQQHLHHINHPQQAHSNSVYQHQQQPQQQQQQQQHHQHVTSSEAQPKNKGRKKKNGVPASSAPVPLPSQSKPALPVVAPEKAKPVRPKGTPNAYALFYKETYGKLRSENPDWKASQIMAEAGRIWKEMNGALQQRYRAEAESLGAAHQLLHAKTSHKKQKNAQKRPMTAYQLFIREHFGQRPPSEHQMHAKDFLLQLSVQWKQLDENEKKMYQDKAKAEKAKREAEKAQDLSLATESINATASGAPTESEPVREVQQEAPPVSDSTVAEMLGQAHTENQTTPAQEETHTEVEMDHSNIPSLPQKTEMQGIQLDYGQEEDEGSQE
ncbi:hypothetical protein RvY_14926 [Ramazzottius varieornatus]|uniref:HMG box domain-containing protein n=1 Tax=Ramazzottius varieornatus TaxID=947166 RepID=A0A1D1VUQ4_RAMVA|nr:hypothetical protein RvY_14926 [Ramazzottius varieornatus]